MDDPIDIRPERPGDEDAIHAVTTAAFLHAPHTSHTEQFIVRDLRRRGRLAVSLVAECAGQVIGHVAISPVVVGDGADGWFGMGPVSVAPEHQGRGVGSRLVREALQQLRVLGASGCVLVGEPAYYGRFGFAADRRLVLPDVPPEYFQALRFDPSTSASGTVTFDAAFAVQQ